jgi:hypothetical protein
MNKSDGMVKKLPALPPVWVLFFIMQTIGAGGRIRKII